MSSNSLSFFFLRLFLLPVWKKLWISPLPHFPELHRRYLDSVLMFLSFCSLGWFTILLICSAIIIVTACKDGKTGFFALLVKQCNVFSEIKHSKENLKYPFSSKANNPWPEIFEYNVYSKNRCKSIEDFATH